MKFRLFAYSSHFPGHACCIVVRYTYSILKSSKYFFCSPPPPFPPPQKIAFGLPENQKTRAAWSKLYLEASAKNSNERKRFNRGRKTWYFNSLSRYVVNFPLSSFFFFNFSVLLAVFMLEDALSVWTNLGKHLLLDALCVSSRRTIFCCASFKTNNE